MESLIIFPFFKHCICAIQLISSYMLFTQLKAHGVWTDKSLWLLALAFGFKRTPLKKQFIVFLFVTSNLNRKRVDISSRGNRSHAKLPRRLLYSTSIECCTTDFVIQWVVLLLLYSEFFFLPRICVALSVPFWEFYKSKKSFFVLKRCVYFFFVV